MTETTGHTHYWRLRQDILDGAFPQDAPLLETALSDRYGTSRGPIREALTLLEHDGLIERGVRGYRVRSGRPEDVVEIYEARIALEAEAAGAAALRHTDLDLARLTRQHELCHTAPDDASARAENFRFHRTLWKAAHNTTIETLLERLTTRLRIYDSGPPASYGDPALLHTEHDGIMAALRARDPETARAEMRTHLRRSLDLRIQTFAEHP
ncbi:GntR family transcriptional regulator [Actinocorallia sp. API 0066]|uniref:GntR family transcriptional regulator n=1 Tax=Actinocorallia sp. API 0066 TaxID=2896846 RepID=UPI001E3EF5F6|nr:GntR family transcriptional regulator [Actinocorallia sp. API 0066]MCD0449207.1 GntR family transcriptional regulator [Actinocorallia sp. API 0066]